MVASDILPRVSYGSALYCPAGADLKAMAGLASQVGVRRPLGVSKHMVLAVGKAAVLDTECIFTKEGVVRWSRKAWSLGSAKRPADASSALKVAQAAKKASQAHADGTKIR